MATMQRMIELGREAVIRGQADFSATVTERDGVPTEAKQTALTDALVNMRHWADSQGLDWRVIYGSAMDTHYPAETGTPLDEEPVA